MKKKMKTCAFTGHRPQNLPFGFNEEDERCIDLKKTLREQIINLIEMKASRTLYPEWQSV